MLREVKFNLPYIFIYRYILLCVEYLGVAKFLFNLPDQQLNSLRELSRSTDTPMAAHIRSAIADYFAGRINVIMSGNNLTISVSGNMFPGHQ